MTSCLISFSTSHSTPPLVCCGCGRVPDFETKNNYNFTTAGLSSLLFVFLRWTWPSSFYLVHSTLYTNGMHVEQEINRKRLAIDCTDTRIQNSMSTSECESSESVSTTTYVGYMWMSILRGSTIHSHSFASAARSRTSA